MQDDLMELRRTVLRKVSYGLNTIALIRGDVPPDGPYDAALTNGLASIATFHKLDIHESGSMKIKPASKLIKAVKKLSLLESADAKLLEDGNGFSQAFRHGRADNEWVSIDTRHITVLANLDEHEGLQIISKVRGLNFESAALRLWWGNS